MSRGRGCSIRNAWFSKALRRGADVCENLSRGEKCLASPFCIACLIMDSSISSISISDDKFESLPGLFQQFFHQHFLLARWTGVHEGNENKEKNIRSIVSVMDLQNSKMISFIDNENSMALYFCEGQKLIHDLMLLHMYEGESLRFFRDAVLSVVPMLSQLKQGEGIGFYIDAEKPAFMYKIELYFSGDLRTMLMPRDMQQFPESISGSCRFVKSYASARKENYTSMIELHSESWSNIINRVLEQSFQMESFVRVSEDADQSVMISALPALSSQNEESLSPREYWLQHAAAFTEIFQDGSDDEEALINRFAGQGLKYLHSRELKVSCACSREQFLATLRTLDPNELFPPGEDRIEISCDYCHTTYQIIRDEVQPER